MFVLVFYGIFALAALAVPALVFRALRKRGALKALLASSLTLALAVLFFPIPVHGGFTFLFEVMVQELRSERSRVAELEVSEAKAAFLREMAARFKGPLVLPVRQPVDEQWASLVTADGARGWYDAGSRLAWTGPRPFAPSGARPDLESAKAFCAQIAPRGFWALPTEAELSRFWKAGGYRLSPLGDYGTAGLLENVDFQTELLSVRSSRNGAYALRCVALGPGAPAGGYLTGDIPLPEWNAYQLQKTMPGFPRPEQEPEG